MKSLGYINDPAAFASTRELLRSRGIPTYVEAAGRNIYRSVVFVCINQQYDDAVALMKDPNHVVAQPVDVEAFEAAAQNTGMGTILRGSLVFLAFLLLLVGVATAFYFWRAHA